MPIKSRAELAALDAADPLAPFRDRFLLPEGVIYLDGNSLGPLPRATPARIADVVSQEWGQGLIRSWNDAGWIDLSQRIADKIARLIGAQAGSVAVGDSTSVNIFKLLAAALAARPDRTTILSERQNFPTDLYVAQGLVALLGGRHSLRLEDAEAVGTAIDASTAVVMLTHVNYRSGAMHDMAALTRIAHAHGALVLWDLAHSTGAVPLDLVGCDADFAVGCGYKFLNGGPGAPAFLYVAPRLHDKLRLPITGWLGHEAPFAFETEFRPAAAMARAVVGTPPVLSLAALEVGVDLALEAPMHQLRDKSVRQCTILADLIARFCKVAFRLVSPGDPSRAGSQVCFAHPHAAAVMQALIARGVIGDFRAPDILRFGITPLTLRYVDLWDTAAQLGDIMTTGAWEAVQFRTRRKVT